MKIPVARICAVLMLLLAPWRASAAAIEVGKPLPGVAIADRGELLPVDGKARYQPWHSHALRGQLVVLQHMSARLSAKAMLQKFNDDMEQRAYTPEQVRVAVVVNLDDALWGTTALIESELTGNKKKHPQSNIVADTTGLARKTWGLQEKSAALMLLDRDGSVLFFSEGKVHKAGRDEVFALIEQRLAP